MKAYKINLDELDRATVAQLGGTCENTANGCRIDESDEDAQTVITWEE